MFLDSPPWPSQLWIVRHGQCAENVARDEAHEAALDRIALDGRDVDVPFKPFGRGSGACFGPMVCPGFRRAAPGGYPVVAISPSHPDSTIVQG